ncbi:hypothetical protein Tco_0488007 [Tanacetum coccineum]
MDSFAIKFMNEKLAMSIANGSCCSNKEWLVQGGTALGKDIIKSVNAVNDLPKIHERWFYCFYWFKECGASESAGVYVSSLHSQHICSYAHMLVKCFAAVPRYVVPTGKFIITYPAVIQLEFLQ